MISPHDLASLRREGVLAVVAAWQRQVAEGRAAIDELTRGGKRPAAPLSRGTRGADPKPPERKPGAGPFRDREARPPEAITEPLVDVRVSLDTCPACGGPRAEARVDGAYTTAWPALPRPPGTPYRVWGCRCVVCGQRVRGQHPDVAPDQDGAPAPRLGARVLAAAQTLYDGRGMPVRKVPAVLNAWPGVQLTPGALPQDALQRPPGPLLRGVGFLECEIDMMARQSSVGHLGGLHEPQ
jgi:transposase